MIMSFKQRTEPRIKHADKIEPQNMGLDLLIGYYVCPCWNCVVFLLWSLDWVPKSPIANRPSCRSKWSEGEEACQCFLLYILFCISLINPKGWYLQFRWNVNSVKNLHVDYHVPLHWRCAMTGVGYLGCWVTTKDHSRVKQRNQKKVFLRTILLRRTKLKQQPLLWCLILIIKLIDNPGRYSLI